MRTYISSVILILIVGIPGYYPVTGARQCRCLANDASCWPSASAWQSFNESVGGRLVLPLPSASVCNEPTYDISACEVAKTQWHNATWRSDLVGATQNYNWENSSCSAFTNISACTQGSIPVYAVDALIPEHVQETVRFAAVNNLRLVIKNTGHDYLGRSTAAGSLLLWLHHMKNMTLLENYTTCDGVEMVNAARISAGAQWGEVYRWLHTYNLVAIGGASGSVGAIGGYLQGGGHSPLSRWKGMAADQVLEYEVVTADGRRLIVNSCREQDLFWALNGGGSGTYAIVLSAILRTFPSPSIAFAAYEIPTPNEKRYRSLMIDVTRMLSDVVKIGWSGYFTMVDTKISGIFHVPNGNLTVVIDRLSQFAAQNPDLNFNKTSFRSFSSFYDYFSSILEPSNPTGFNVLLSSRLIRESTLQESPGKVADVFIQAKGQSLTGSLLLGHIVAGGQVSNTQNRNNSINPGWRTALLHMVYSQGWLDTTPKDIQAYLATEVTRRTTILDQLSTDSNPSCYSNEADPNEVNWQVTFYGSATIYNQLKSVKNRYDPNGLFVCERCVGSDDWTADLNCPKELTTSAPTGSTRTGSVTTHKYSVASNLVFGNNLLLFMLVQAYLLVF